MKFFKVANGLITDKSITSNEFRIYVYLLSLYNENKECVYPSIETISINTNISVATVKKSIKRLVELIYMIIEKKKGISGNFNIYKHFEYLVKKSSSNIKVVDKKQSNENKKTKENKKGYYFRLQREWYSNGDQ